MKRLQVAAAVASLFGVGLAHAASVESSGATVAAETVFKTGTIGESTRVRAPSFSYKYDGGVTASDTVQRFAISAVISGLPAAQWSTNLTPGNNTLDPLSVATTIGDGSPLARTIQAFATVRGVNGRIPVLMPSDPIPDGTFAIVLDTVQRGNRISPQGTSTNANNVSDDALTFKFSIINRSGSGINLAGLDLQFNTQKQSTPAPGAAGSINFGGIFAAADVGTDATATGTEDSGQRYLWIWRINQLSADTGTSCTDAPAGNLVLDVASGVNEPPQLSSEESLNNTGIIRTRVPNYLNIERALTITLGKDGDRIIQTTNSFPTNLGANPTNGIGGTGGGRFTFKPSVAASYTPNFGNSIIVDSPTSVGGNPTIGNAALALQPNANIAGGAPGLSNVRGSSGDERDAKIGTITFTNRSSSRAILDRILDSDPFAFKAQVGTGAVNVRADRSNLASGPGANGDFTAAQVNQGGAPGNVFGGVDIGALPGIPGALTIEFDSKPNRLGFAPASRLVLVRGTSCLGAAAALGAVSINPLSPVDLPTIAGGAPNTQRYRWAISAGQLALLTQGADPLTQTLANQTFQVCYAVPGTTTIPSSYFRAVEVKLNKDDTTEQSNLSCRSNFAEIYGGVKVDVRNYQARTSDSSWRSVVRVINNSEEDTATVEAQYIWDTGAYGLWGVLGTLAPRASMILGSEQIAQLLTTTPQNPPPGATVNPAVPQDVKTRLRINADVSTIRVQNYLYNIGNGQMTEASAAQGADFVNIDSSNRDHIDQDAQRDIVK